MTLRQTDSNTHSTDPILVCGSGIAGSLAAIHLAEHRPVTLVTKYTLGTGSTARAQGGLAAAVGQGDSVEAHFTDTIAAGAGLCDPDAARALCAYGPACVRELMQHGVIFDGGDPPALGLEAAHSASRIVHIDGDATGAGIMAALRRAVSAHPMIEIHDDLRAREVVRENGRAVGLACRSDAGVETVLRGDAVVLATGGLGQLFPFTTNPIDATGDGIAMAARAGAALVDMEMVQFHPTALAVGGSPLPLISEAVRGAGAYLRDRRGRRFLDGRDGMTELSPRDQVARAIYRRSAEDGEPVTLDLSHLDAEAVRARFPGITQTCAEHGLDLARDPIPVTPAAHYFMGGVMSDSSGRTTLPGLFTIGECSSTGAHGANRLASNSLLEGALMAHRVSEAIADDPTRALNGPLGRGSETPRTGPADTDWRARLGRHIWDGAGLEREAGQMAVARREIERLAPAPRHEDANLHELALVMLDAAAARCESRGAHFRTDFPTTDPAQARRVAWVDRAPVELDQPQVPSRSAA